MLRRVPARCRGGAIMDRFGRHYDPYGCYSAAMLTGLQPSLGF